MKKNKNTSKKVLKVIKSKKFGIIMYSILAVIVVAIGGTMIWAYNAPSYDLDAFEERIKKQQNDSAYEVYLDEHLNGDKNSATEEVTDANEDEVIQEVSEKLVTCWRTDDELELPLSAEEQIEVFVEKQYLINDDNIRYISVSDLNMDGILEFTTMSDDENEPFRIYRVLNDNKIGWLISQKQTIITPVNDRDFMEQINCYEQGEEVYFVRMLQSNFEYEEIYICSCSYDATVAWNLHGREWSVYPFISQSGNATFVIECMLDNMWGVFQRPEGYDDYEQERFDSVDSFEVFWKYVEGEESFNKDILLDSYEKFKRTENKYSSLDSRLNNIYDSVEYASIIDAKSNRTLYSVATECSSFAEGEKVDIDKCGGDLMWLLITDIGEDVLTDEMKWNYDNPISMMSRVDKESFDFYMQDVLGVKDLDSVYNHMREPWVIVEMGVFYDPNDGYVYAYMGAIGYYSKAICISNEVYEDGYLATYLICNEACGGYIRRTKIYYVPADNSYGYVIKSVEAEDNIWGRTE